MEAGSERVCYVHCNFCNTVLVVNVPCNNMLNIVTVRCGHCANLLPVNMGSLLQPSPTQNLPQQQKHQHQTCSEQGAFLTSSANMNYSCGSASSSSPAAKSKTNNKASGSFEPPMIDRDQQQPPSSRPLPPVRSMEKRQRVPSAYNRFIKEEIQRIKASNPDISHREAFSAAAKNWAHFPHIHFGLKKAKVLD